MPDQTFEMQLDQFAREAAEMAAQFAPAIAEQILDEVLTTGPYWSGRSKASWTLSLDAPITIEAGDVPKKPGGISDSEARERAMATRANLTNFRIGQTIYLSQGTLYLELINSGAHPGSNNVGFVEAALAKFIGLVDMEVSL